MKRLGVVAFAVLLLAGCAADPVASDPDPTPTPTAEAVARPASLWELSCEQLLPAATVDAMVGPEVGPQPFPWVSAALTGAAAIQQVGGITCGWAQAGSFSSEAIVTVLPDAADAFAEFASVATTLPAPFTSADHFDGLFVRCADGAYDARGNQCYWIALSNGVSVTASFQQLGDEALQNPHPAPNPDTSLPAAIPTIEGSAGLAALETIFEAIESAAPVELEPLPEPGTASCADLTTDEISTALGLAASDVSATSSGPDPIGEGFPESGFFHAAAARTQIGATGCGFTTSSSEPTRITATVAPGLGWVLAYPDQPAGPQTTVVGDLGTGQLTCSSNEDSQGCIAAVEVDGTLFVVEAYGTGLPPITEPNAIALLAGLLP